MINNFECESFTFLDCIVDPQANVLIKKSKEKRIEAKVMSLLVLLASHSGEVITRQKILTSIWPDVVVGDEIISQLVYSLRNALGDDAKNPRYIETIPKKGYRFIAKVERVVTQKIISAVPEETSSSVNNLKPYFTIKWLLACCLTLLVIIIVAVGKVTSQDNEKDFIIDSVLPVTQEIGVESDFSFHDAHNQMVYVSSNHEGVDLYLKTLGTSSSQRLTKDAWKEYSPLWFDAQTLIYIRKQAGQYQIVRYKLQQDVEILYETTNRLINLAINSAQTNELTFVEYDHYRHNRLNELKSLNLTNNESYYLHDSLRNLPNEVYHPLYSGDGNTLFFFNNSDKVKKIVSLNLKNNQYTTIANNFTSISHLSLIDEDNLLVSGQLSTTKGIWKVSISNKSISRMLPSTGGHKFVRGFFKQGQLYYSTHKTSINQMIADIKTQTFIQLPNLNSDANEHSGIYSKDNSMIYFVSNRTGYYELWAYDVKSKKPSNITQIEAAFIYKPLLSHDEKYLAVVYQAEKLTMAIISVATGKVITKAIIPSRKFPLAWSVNDENIYISEHKEQVNIYLYDRHTLQPTLIQKRAGLFAQESNDATGVTLVDYNVGGLINKKLNTEQKTLLNNSIENLISLIPGEFKVINSSIFAVNHDGSLSSLIQYPLVEKTAKVKGKWLMDLPKGALVSDFNLNGTKAIFTHKGLVQGDIMKIIFSH